MTELTLPPLAPGELPELDLLIDEERNERRNTGIATVVAASMSAVFLALVGETNSVALGMAALATSCMTLMAGSYSLVAHAQLRKLRKNQNNPAEILPERLAALYRKKPNLAPVTVALSDHPALVILKDDLIREWISNSQRSQLYRPNLDTYLTSLAAENPNYPLKQGVRDYFDRRDISLAASSQPWAAENSKSLEVRYDAAQRVGQTLLRELPTQEQLFARSSLHESMMRFSELRYALNVETFNENAETAKVLEEMLQTHIEALEKFNEALATSLKKEGVATALSVLTEELTHKNQALRDLQEMSGALAPLSSVELNKKEA